MKGWRRTLVEICANLDPAKSLDWQTGCTADPGTPPWFVQSWSPPF
jgi:hypothetical protein